MAALELAFENVSLKDKNDTEPYMQKIADLVKELDECINNNSTPEQL